MFSWTQLLHDVVGSAAPTDFRILGRPVSNWPFNSLVTSGWLYPSTDAASFNALLVMRPHPSITVCLKNKIHHREGSFYWSTFAGVCMVWFMPTALPRLSTAPFLLGILHGKRGGPLSPVWAASPAVCVISLLCVQRDRLLVLADTNSFGSTAEQYSALLLEIRHIICT